MKIKILSWNIWYYCKFELVKKFLAEIDADVIGLQEVLLDDESRDTIGYLKRLGYRHFFAPRGNEGGYLFGNAIFSKYDFLKTDVKSLSETEMRNVIRADIKIGNKILNFFCTHLHHPHLESKSEEQVRQVERLISFVERKNSIIVGDLNGTPDSDAIKMMQKNFVDTDSESLPTWSVYPEGCDVCKPKSLNIRFDYIFTTKDIKTDSFNVYKDSRGSDHLPISIELT